MTDSPTHGACPPPGHRHWRRTRPAPPPRRSRTDSLSPPRIACAARHRRQGPTAASRSGPGPDPGPRCLTRRCPKQAENEQEKINNKNRGLTGPAPSGMTDITEHPTKEGKLYCAAGMDAYARLIVGWSIADHMRTELVVDALGMATLRRRLTSIGHQTLGYTAQSQPTQQLKPGPRFESVGVKRRGERSAWLRLWCLPRRGYHRLSSQLPQ
jgi:transposase InsO family protein